MTATRRGYRAPPLPRRRYAPGSTPAFAAGWRGRRIVAGVPGPGCPRGVRVLRAGAAWLRTWARAGCGGSRGRR